VADIGIPLSSWPSLVCTQVGRTIADVLLPDGTFVNHTLVKDGWCWWYRKYAPEDRVLEGL
jgi:endonuclease YncB( thermonuclease family)